MFKKFFPLLAVVLAILTLAGFGCKGLTAEEQQATTSVSLEYWTVYDDVDALRALIAKYTAERPYLKVNIRQLRSDELYPRLIEALAEDKGPDIISVNARDLQSFRAKLAPMPKTVGDATVAVVKKVTGNETVVTRRTITMPTVAQIDREFVQTVKKDAVVGEDIFGLPLSLDLLAVYFNKDLLDRSDVAEPPAGWTDFQAAAKKISRLDKETGKVVQSGAAIGTGVNVEGFEDIIYALTKQSEADFVSRDGRAVFNQIPSGKGEALMAGALDFYTDFANPTRDTYGWNAEMGSAFDNFAAGKTAFFFGYSFHNATLKSRAPQLNYGILPLFQLNPEKPANAANYWLQTVVGKSKHQSEAWALIYYLTSAGSADEYLTATKRPTARRALIAKQKEDTELNPFVSQALIADNWYRGRDYAAATKAMSDMVGEWLAAPTDTDANRLLQARQQILNRAAAKINQTL